MQKDFDVTIKHLIFVLNLIYYRYGTERRKIYKSAY